MLRKERFMKKIFGLLVFLGMMCGSMAHGIDELPIVNPQSNGTISIKVNDNGTIKEALNIGPSGVKGAGFQAKNYLINGKFDIWQRGTSGFSSSSTTWIYAADRWVFFGQAGGTGTATVQRAGPMTGEIPTLQDSVYNFRWQQTVAPTGDVAMGQRIEDVRTLAGKTVTATVWLDGSAGPLYVYVNQNFGSGGSPTVLKSCSLGAISGTYGRYSCSVTLDSVAGKTFGTNHYLEFAIVSKTSATFTYWIYGAMLNEGSVAAPFQLAGGDIDGETTKALRYYWSIPSGALFYLVGRTNSTTNLRTSIFLPTIMRSNPYVTFTTNGSAFGNGVTSTMTNQSGVQYTQYGNMLFLNIVLSGSIATNTVATAEMVTFIADAEL